MSDWSQQISQGAVVLTVNQRLARHHMMRYQQQQLQAGRSTWETPAILPYRSWMASIHSQALGLGLCDVTVVPGILVQQQWRRIVDTDSSVQLLDSVGAASSALQAWQLSCVWQCHNREELYLSGDQFTWQRWMTRYRSWLDARVSIDEALLPGELISILNRASREQLDALLPRQLILDGFLQLPRQLAQLFDRIAECGTELVVQTRQPSAVVHRVQYADDESELLSIATAMRAELERDSQQTLGLVIPELQLRRDRVVRAFERVFYPGMSPLQIRAEVPAYEISLGQSLKDQPLVDMALTLIRLSISHVNGHDVSAMLLSPYWLAASTERRRREQLDRRLRDQRVRSLTMEQLEECLYKASRLKPALATLRRQRKLNAVTLSDWASRFSLWLKTLGWPGESIDSAEYQMHSAWFECLDDMQLLDEGQRVSVNKALEQLSALAADRIFQLETPATPIQVMGRLESHALAFDCLWVAGLDGEAWPPSGSANAFLSIAEQKACDIPECTAGGRLALANQEFALWASQAPLLVASFASLRDGKELVPAAIPEFTPIADPEASVRARLSRLEKACLPVDPARVISQSLSMEVLEDFHGPALVAGVKVDGGARLFENQALCPFRAFALHRLKVRPLEEVGLGLDPRQHGTLLHGALEVFWQTVRTHDKLLSLSDDERKQLVHTAVLQAVSDAPVSDELKALECTRLVRLVDDWLVQCEMIREPFEVLELEQKLRIEHGGIIMDVVIDRIDDVGGAQVVIDYKTGVHNRVSPWADDRIANPQLPLYVLTDDAIEAVSFAQVAANQCRFIGVASDDTTLPKVSTKVRQGGDTSGAPIDNWTAWRDHWRTSFDAIAKELQSGVATVTPMKLACTHCELSSLCRIGKNDSAELQIDTDGASASSPRHNVAAPS